MTLLSLFTTVVLAAETIISPIADEPHQAPSITTKPRISFGTLSASPQVLGIAIENPAEKPVHKARKSAYTIALIGDSMIDTLGPDLGELRDALKKIYPSTTFTLLNYGVGGTNIDYGIERLTKDYEYLGNHIPSLISQKPDVVVVESFGYNPYPFDTGALDRHWLALSTIVDTMKRELPDTNIVIAGTIAPNPDIFGDGVLNWSTEGKWKKSKEIATYIESTIKFAKSQHLPLADAYHPSLDSRGYGKALYINPGDHIHPSDAGRQLFDRIVADTIATNKLLE